MSKRLRKDRKVNIHGVTYNLTARDDDLPQRFTWSWVCGSCKGGATIAGIADSIADAVTKAFVDAKEHHAKKHSDLHAE